MSVEPRPRVSLGLCQLLWTEPPAGYMRFGGRLYPAAEAAEMRRFLEARG